MVAPLSLDVKFDQPRAIVSRDFDRTHFRPAGASSTPLDERLEHGGIGFGEDLHATVGTVSYRSCDPEATGLSVTSGSVSDALDPSGHDDPHSRLVRHVQARNESGM
jgi:hypothetical protein